MGFGSSACRGHWPVCPPPLQLTHHHVQTLTGLRKLPHHARLGTKLPVEQHRLPPDKHSPTTSRSSNHTSSLQRRLHCTRVLTTCRNLPGCPSANQLKMVLENIARPGITVSKSLSGGGGNCLLPLTSFMQVFQRRAGQDSRVHVHRSVEGCHNCDGGPAGHTTS